LNSVDVHLGARILERIVERKHVLVVDIFSGWAFLEHLFLPARQALKRAPQNHILWNDRAITQRKGIVEARKLKYTQRGYTGKTRRTDACV
jgi:hypothetical protein